MTPHRFNTAPPRRPSWAVTLTAAVFTLLVGTVALPDAAECGDWPQFRGPNRDGLSKEAHVVDSWGAGGPKVLWRAQGGAGYSALSVADGRLFTLVSRGGDELAVAYDADSGKELWAHRLDSAYKNSFGDGPRSTPTVDGDTVYVVGAQGQLAALDVATGKPRWTQDLKKSFGAKPPTWGVSMSPLVLGDSLLLDVGGKSGSSMVALNKRNGVVRWQTGTDLAGYSAPLPLTAAGRDQVIFFTGTRLVSVDPDDGAELWSKGWKTEYDVNAATPIFIAPDRLFVSSGYGHGASLFRLRAKEGGGVAADELWSTRDMKNQFSSSVHVGGTLYGFDNSILTALDAKTGDELWQARGFGHGSLTYADGKLIVLSDKGKLALVEAAPGGYKELASHQLFKGKTWTVPTLSGGTLYVRDENEIVALDLSDTPKKNEKKKG